jgi:poly-beta-1,6-N-acetyl-D-glucosamine synthase
VNNDPWPFVGGGRKLNSLEVTVLVPCRNEERNIEAAVEGIRRQSYPVDRIIVVADNCTDKTADVARELGVTVFETVGNTDRKAGALNQAIEAFADELGEAVLVTDADSVLSEGFCRRGVELLERKPNLGAVGGVFFAHEPRGFLERCQANEFTRYGYTIYKRNDAVQVLTGTAALVRTEALRDLLAWRGFVYDPKAITEDMELTLALRARGWELKSPPECTVSTELMPTPHDLGVQRLRWYRGALDALSKYGWTPVTRRYWLQQAGLLVAVVAMCLYVFWTGYTISTGNAHFSPFWALIGLGFVFERVVTVRAAGQRAKLLAVLLLPEIIYSVGLQVIFLRAMFSWLRGERISWNISERGR